MERGGETIQRFDDDMGEVCLAHNPSRSPVGESRRRSRGGGGSHEYWRSAAWASSTTSRNQV